MKCQLHLLLRFLEFLLFPSRLATELSTPALLPAENPVNAIGPFSEKVDALVENGLTELLALLNPGV